jgi:hypothetical protein
MAFKNKVPPQPHYSLYKIFEPFPKKKEGKE